MIILDEENNKAILKEFKANIILMNSKFSRDPNTDRESEDFITIETRKSNKNDLKIRRKKLFEIEVNIHSFNYFFCALNISLFLLIILQWLKFHFSITRFITFLFIFSFFFSS